MSVRLGILLFTISLLRAQELPSDFDEIVAGIFNKPTPATTDGPCECVAYYNCLNGTVNVYGVDIIDIRFKDECDNYMQRCCKLPMIVNGTESGTKNPSVSTTPGPKTTQPPGPKTTPLPVSRVCGKRNPNGVKFHITGANENEAQFGEFPWMTAILQNTPTLDANSIKIYVCGGSLIHPQVVLTAAHCVSGKSNLLVRAGEWDTQHATEPYRHQERRVQKIIIHPQYNNKALFNEVALLILDSPVELTHTVNTVCLPPQNAEIVNRRCYATGWGKDLFGKQGTYQVILKKKDLPMVQRPTCLTALRKTRLGQRFQLHQSFVCAGGEPGKDMCTGDGGSPLVCPISGTEERYQETGIVSWGIGCGNDTPGVYVNVAKFRNWIDEQMVRNDLNPSSYQI